MCRWMPDPRNSEANWRVEQFKMKDNKANKVLCMSMTPFQLDAEQFENFNPSIDSSDNTFTARLWSSKLRRLKSSQLVSYRCLTMSYLIKSHIGKTKQPKPTLSLLRHSSG
ncbi:unnamed protein product [Trichobilharzia regenti]|nr:unnamed protein product [Trichobilharzia regenti]